MQIIQTEGKYETVESYLQRGGQIKLLPEWTPEEKEIIQPRGISKWMSVWRREQ